MRRLIITESDGLWTAETSSGLRASGASLGSAVAKLWPVSERHPDFVDIEKVLTPVFATITPVNAGQIVAGQAGA